MVKFGPQASSLPSTADDQQASSLATSITELNLTQDSQQTPPPLSNDGPQFAPFPRLATELQDLVWGFTLPGPRNIVIHPNYVPTGTLLSPYDCTICQLAVYNRQTAVTKTPITLRICQNSRAEAIKTYKLVSAPSLTRKRFYINFDRDTVVVDMSYAVSADPSNFPYEYKGTTSLLKNLKYLVFNAPLNRWTIDHVSKCLKLEEATVRMEETFEIPQFRQWNSAGTDPARTPMERRAIQENRLVKDMRVNAKLHKTLDFKPPIIKHLGKVDFKAAYGSELRPLSSIR